MARAEDRARRRGVLGGTFLLVACARLVHAGCNTAPPVPGTWPGTKGYASRPFSYPGELVQIGLRPCDGATFTGKAEDHVVTVAFPSTGAKRTLVALTAGACGPAIEGACGPAVGPVECRHVAVPTDLELTPAPDARLGFRFPDTSRELPPGGDTFPITGPAAIAVKRATDAPPVACGLAAGPCAGQTGLLACVDRLYEATPPCGTVPNALFTELTALPFPTGFRTECFDDPAVCNPWGTADHQFAIAVDAEGNLLLPIRWSGISPSTSAATLKRMVRGVGRPRTGHIRIPGPSFISSYSPEGRTLWPYLDLTPDADPAEIAGSVDSPTYTVVRVARRVGRCSGGPDNGKRCPGSCPNGTCVPICVGGRTPGAECATKPCGGNGVCGRLFDLAPDREGSIGPVVFRRTEPLVCRQGRHSHCSRPGHCPGPGNACDGYAVEADADPLPLTPDVETSRLFAYVLDEQAVGRDRNGDGDATDAVVIVRAKPLGEVRSIGGGPAACGFSAAVKPAGRAVAPGTRAGAPLVIGEDDVIAFLESEAGQHACDENGNRSTTDAILRIFALREGQPAKVPKELTAPAQIATDPASVVNGQSLAISERRVFFRAKRKGVTTPMLQVFDTTKPLNVSATRNPNPKDLGPATQVGVAGGTAAFIGPEEPRDASCAPDAQGVHLWTPEGGIENLRRAAATVAVSGDWVAAVTLDGGRQVSVWRIGGSSWTDLHLPAEDVALSGSVIAFLAPEGEKGEDLNGDGDREDKVLHVYDAASGSGVATNTHVAAEDFVLGEPVADRIAFRTRTKHDDRVDAVLGIYDVGRATVVDTGESTLACPPPACPPRRPYRLEGRQLRFLARECDRPGPTRKGCKGGGTDLDGDGDAADVVVRLYDVETGQTTTLGPVAEEAERRTDPLRATDGALVFPSLAGRCVPQPAAGPPCGPETFEDPALGACVLGTPSLCQRREDCPATATCEPVTMTRVVSLADANGDGLPDGSTPALAPAPRASRCPLRRLLPSCLGDP